MVSFLGDFFICKFQKNEDFVFFRVDFKNFLFRAKNLVFDKNNYFAISSLKGEIAVFSLEKNYSNFLEDTNFEIISKFKIENNLSYDHNWVKMQFSQKANNSKIFCISNNLRKLVIFDFTKKTVF